MRIEPAKDGRNMKDVIDHPSPSKDTSIVENHDGDGNNNVDANTDTATDSYDGESTEQESQYSYDDDDDGRPLPMPPLKYARIMGCLPRNGTSTALSVKITCSTMGRVVVQPSPLSDKQLDSSMSSGSRHGDGGLRNDDNAAEWTDADEEADMAVIKIHHVLALGFEDGKVRLVDVLTGGSVLFGSSPGDGGAWFVHSSTAKRGPDHQSGHAIVALSFDSSSSYLSAMNANGDAAIFGPLIWGKQTQGLQTTVPGQRLGFLSSLGGKVAETAGSDYEGSHTTRPAFTLLKPPASTVRFTYADPQSFTSSLLGGGSSAAGEGCHPTCMVLDPSYARRKEHALIAGFDDGRLLLSKIQGTSGIGSGITSLFGGGAGNAAGGGTVVSKVDSVLYQGTGASSFSGDNAGIEAVTWRGGLVAWADSSGVRIFDIEAMARIAHIDRPTGARSSLYPTISSLHPSIFFERSDSLLIGWGDCLMALVVRDSLCTVPAPKDGLPAKEIKRKTVEVTMAWELDCVACSVVPVDEKHVAVLGLVPSPTQSHDDGEGDQLAMSSTSGQTSSVAGGDNLLELQVINRESGKSISNDRLPLADQPTQRHGKNTITTAHASEFCLLSTFSCPRMDGSAEWDALGNLEKESMREMFNFGLESSSDKVLDFHMRWDISKDVCSVGDEILSEAVIYDDDRSVASDCSVFSDNYVFALSEPIGDILPLSDFPARSPPPAMTVVYSYDACLVQTRDVDDVISYTRSLGKPALALRQALSHRRDVRRHGLDLLIDDFFTSLLRMGNRRRERPLSFSRLKIAAESLPILLGGDSRMWQRWIFMFSRVPGGLFVISEKIPVRDPELPKYVFEMCLEKMLGDVLSNYNGGDHKTTAGYSRQGEEQFIGEKMADLFLDTLRSWGTTSHLRRRMQLHRYFVQNQQWGLQWRAAAEESIASRFAQQSEKILQRRFSQTAFGVLANSRIHPMRQCIDSSRDSLFDVDNLLARLATRLQLRDNENIVDNGVSSNVTLGGSRAQCAVLVESMAELELMRERFDRAVGYYLALGSQFMDTALTKLEESAVRIVNSFGEDSINHPAEGPGDHMGNEKYCFVLSLIELHQLSHLLLKRNYFFDNDDADSLTESPVVALIMLVGLARAGRFLVENCSLPEDTQLDNDEEAAHDGSNLPLDCLANQLKPWPKLLYWFLFHIFANKADMYVSFPTTAVPPPAIIDLHRAQFALFVEYAAENVVQPSDDKPTPTTLVNCPDTPFMAFLRAALPHGGIQAGMVRESLEKCRGGNPNTPVFARELAFVIENFGNGSIEDSNAILQLYLLGAKNLYLAVAFAERSSKYSGLLWDKLIQHCTTPGPTSDANQNSAMGALFGSLLEAAAHTGSDLANLVSKIPTGMSIEGLRPKLIAAVTDYRYKLKIHDHVDTMLMEDKISILRELSHVSRRGERILSVDRCNNCVIKANDNTCAKQRDLLKSSRQNISPSHTSFSLPVR